MVRDGQSKRVTLRCPEDHSVAIDTESWNIRGLEHVTQMLRSVLEPHLSLVMKYHTEGPEAQFAALQCSCLLLQVGALLFLSVPFSSVLNKVMGRTHCP